MKIWIDSREKKCDHIKAYFDKHGIDYEIRKLDEGDYQIDGQPNMTVDRKKDMQEMYNCVVNDKSRFYKEVRRCNDKGIKLYILIEHSSQIKTLEDVPKWKSKYGTVSSREIMERLYRLHISYGVEIFFCSKRQTAQKIIEILSQNIDT